MSTTLLNHEPVKPEYVTPHVELLGFGAVNRVCGLCADDQDPDNLPAGWTPPDSESMRAGFDWRREPRPVDRAGSRSFHVGFIQDVTLPAESV